MPAVNINLLPIELSAKSGVAKTAALLKRISTAALVVFLILGALAGAFMIIFSLQINSITKNNDNLKSQISALEITEQKNVLVKDRLAKIKIINTQNDILPVVDNLKSIALTVPSGVSISDANIDILGKATFGFKVSDTSSLVEFLANLVANSNFKSLTIKNFSYNPNTGYQISFEASNK